MNSKINQYYWRQIIWLYKLIIGTFVLFVVSIGLVTLGLPDGIGFFGGLLLLIALAGSPFFFTYYAYRDMRELSKKYQTASRYHWLIIALLVYVTAGTYMLIYGFFRYSRYDMA